MASTLYGAAHGYESVPSELPSTSYETSTLPRPRLRNRLGKLLAVGVLAATILLSVALSANIKFPRKVPRVRGTVPEVPSAPPPPENAWSDATDLTAFPPADMGVNGTNNHVCCYKSWTAFTDPTADGCSCEKVAEPTSFCA